MSSSTASRDFTSALSSPFIISIIVGTLIVIILFTALCATSCATFCLVFKDRYLLFTGRRQISRLNLQQNHYHLQLNRQTEQRLQLRRCSDARNTKGLAFSFCDKVKFYSPTEALQYRHEYVSSTLGEGSTCRLSKTDRQNQLASETVRKDIHYSLEAQRSTIKSTQKTKAVTVSKSCDQLCFQQSLMPSITSSSSVPSLQLGLKYSIADETSKSTVNSALQVHMQQSSYCESQTISGGQHREDQIDSEHQCPTSPSIPDSNVNEAYYWMPTMSELSVQIRSCPNSPLCLRSTKLLMKQERRLSTFTKITKDRPFPIFSENFLEAEPIKALRNFRPSVASDSDDDSSTSNDASCYYAETSHEQDVTASDISYYTPV